MPTKAEIVNQIEEQIIPNLMELITGGILQNVLLGMVDQINTLVGELDDLNTDDRSSIVNAINELVANIQAIEDNLTPYVYFGLDDPNIVTPVGFGGDIPSFYVQQQHSGLDVVNIGFWTYTGIFGNEWVDLSLSSGGGIQSVQAGANISVDNTDPQNPIINVDYSELTDGTIPMFDEDGNTLKDSNLENTSTGVKVNGTETANAYIGKCIEKIDVSTTYDFNVNNLADSYNLQLVNNTTFTVSNQPNESSITISIWLKGAFTFLFPSGVTADPDGLTYDGLMWNLIIVQISKGSTITNGVWKITNQKS